MVKTTLFNWRKTNSIQRLRFCHKIQLDYEIYFTLKLLHDAYFKQTNHIKNTYLIKQSETTQVITFRVAF